MCCYCHCSCLLRSTHCISFLPFLSSLPFFLPPLSPLSPLSLPSLASPLPPLSPLSLPSLAPLLSPSPLPPLPPPPPPPCSKVCGTPTPAEWPGVVNLPLFNTFKSRKIYRRRVKEEFTR